MHKHFLKADTILSSRWKKTECHFLMLKSKSEILHVIYVQLWFVIFLWSSVYENTYVPLYLCLFLSFFLGSFSCLFYQILTYLFFKFIIVIYIAVVFLIQERKDVDLGGSSSSEDLEGVGGGKIVIEYIA